MSKNLDRYWQLEYQLQHLWSIPHKGRDYKLISRLTAEQSKVRDTLGDREIMVVEDGALTNH